MGVQRLRQTRSAQQLHCATRDAPVETHALRVRVVIFPAGHHRAGVLLENHEHDQHSAAA